MVAMTVDRDTFALHVAKLDEAVQVAVAFPDNAAHTPAYQDALHQVLTGARLLQADVDDLSEPIPDDLRLGLSSCAVALDTVATSALTDRHQPGYFTRRLGPTLDNLRDFAARVGTHWAGA